VNSWLEIGLVLIREMWIHNLKMVKLSHLRSELEHWNLFKCCWFELVKWFVDVVCCMNIVMMCVAWGMYILNCIFIWQVGCRKCRFLHKKFTKNRRRSSLFYSLWRTKSDDQRRFLFIMKNKMPRPTLLFIHYEEQKGTTNVTFYS